jgi:Lon protease-like protein
MPGTDLESLPARFPVFPLSGALLLPGGHLPLNIFEPRYLEMTRDAMRTERVIGMIQPSRRGPQPPPLYGSGCAGKITAFRETEDGRFLITLTGMCRFRVAEELDTTTPYRQVVADFLPYRGDLEPAAPPDELRAPLLAAVRRFFDVQGIGADWQAIEQAPLAGLVTSLSMVCPFEPSEKQALLEADPPKRARTLVTLLQMGGQGGQPAAPDSIRH